MVATDMLAELEAKWNEGTLTEAEHDRLISLSEAIR